MERDDRDKSANDTYDERLKGTFTTVLLIGAFIILTWLGMLYYYLITL